MTEPVINPGLTQSHCSLLCTRMRVRKVVPHFIVLGLSGLLQGGGIQMTVYLVSLPEYPEVWLWSPSEIPTLPQAGFESRHPEGGGKSVWMGEAPLGSWTLPHSSEGPDLLRTLELFILRNSGREVLKVSVSSSFWGPQSLVGLREAPEGGLTHSLTQTTRAGARTLSQL